MGKLAYGLKAVFRASFDEVVRALSRSQRASGVYLEVLNTEPRHNTLKYIHRWVSRE